MGGMGRMGTCGRRLRSRQPNQWERGGEVTGVRRELEEGP
jgi:hypothetical protein